MVNTVGAADGESFEDFCDFFDERRDDRDFDLSELDRLLLLFDLSEFDRLLLLLVDLSDRLLLLLVDLSDRLLFERLCLLDLLFDRPLWLDFRAVSSSEA